jgi:hypothetical protein
LKWYFTKSTAPIKGGVAMKKGKLVRILSTVAILAMIIVNGTISPAAAQENVTISINVPDDVEPGSDIVVTIDISHVENLDAVNYEVTFNDTLLRLDNVTDGKIGGTIIPVDIYNEIGPGRYRIVQNIPGLSGVTDTGYLAALHFHVKDSSGDSSYIRLLDGVIGNNQAEEIPATWNEAFLVVGVLPCDANGDNVVNVFDMTKVARIILELDDPTPGADANQDGTINIFDMTKIARVILELD